MSSTGSVTSMLFLSSIRLKHQSKGIRCQLPPCYTRRDQSKFGELDAQFFDGSGIAALVAEFFDCSFFCASSPQT